MSESARSTGRSLDLQRRLVAYKTYAVWQEVPHVAYQYEPDATDFWVEFQALRNEFRGRGLSLSVNTILLKAAALALAEAPILNASFAYEPERQDGTIHFHDEINLGVPWLLPDGGMITLTVFDSGNQSLAEISSQVEKIRKKVERTDFQRLFRATALMKPGDPWEDDGGSLPWTLRAAPPLSPTSAPSAAARGSSACWRFCRPRFLLWGFPLCRRSPAFLSTRPAKRPLAYANICLCVWPLTTGCWISATWSPSFPGWTGSSKTQRRSIPGKIFDPAAHF